MTQRVCEKCGEVIEKPNRRNIIGYQPWYLKMHLFKKTDEVSEPETAIDLCNRCRNLFDEWIEQDPDDHAGNSDQSSETDGASP
jgi:hypothetical protein